jgi:hypothetical protein
VNDSKITIAPAPMPVMGILVADAIGLAIVAAFIYALSRSPGTEDGRLFGMIGMGAIGVLTISTLTGLMIWSYKKARRDGDWLVIDREAGRLLLPREGRVESLSRLVRFECLTRWKRDHRDRQIDSSLSELQIILSDEAGGEERICLLRAYDGVHRKLCRKLAACAPVPVLRVFEPVFDEALKIVPVEGG